MRRFHRRGVRARRQIAAEAKWMYTRKGVRAQVAVGAARRQGGRGARMRTRHGLYPPSLGACAPLTDIETARALTPL